MKTKIPSKRMPDALRKVLSYYRSERNEGEPFKDFVVRVGAATFEPVLADLAQVPELNRETIDNYMDWDKTVIYKVERGEGECAV